ncbi:adenosinetriphosphatase [Plasmodium inui San Antonio 1]|uniref:Adenosinetriphosphatase n=1 Tax=Plasmodium inui San Antonio 1 TaxID=1237626 RepID=W6ZXK8_9APIC|nr:adenosinetriphosphatase [Plasmodium inui San Antonio 1]EUD65507.1 adenosinetriphosphatase [Plasmodium inui San Antonio 1]
MFRNVCDYFKNSNEKSENCEEGADAGGNNKSDVNANGVNDENGERGTLCDEANQEYYLNEASYKNIGDICNEEGNAENDFRKKYDSYNHADNVRKGCSTSDEGSRKKKDLVTNGDTCNNSEPFVNNCEISASCAMRNVAGESNVDGKSGSNAGSNDEKDSSGESENGRDAVDPEGRSNSRRDKHKLDLSDEALKRRKFAEEGEEAEDAAMVAAEGEENETNGNGEEAIENAHVEDDEKSSEGEESGVDKEKPMKENLEESADPMSEEKVNYLQEKLEQLLSQTKRYTEKLSGQRLKMNVHSKDNKTRRCAMTEKEEDYMLLQDANEEDETFIMKQPANINGCMKPYQIEGLNWLYQLYRHRINGILADEMGLGKTLQTISLLCYLRFNKNIKRKSIIICPRSTLDNWYQEVNKWCTEMKAFKYYGNKEQRRELNKNVLHTDYDVLLTTYEVVIKDKSALFDIDWFFLVIDEAHRIKNDKSVLSSSVRFLRSENRLLITGTPLHNNLKELWSLLNFLMPKIFDNSEEFDNLFNISKISSNDNKQSEIITQLHTILKPFMLRRLKVEVEQSLPPKREIYVFVGMSKLQKKLYSDILSKNIDVLNAMTGSKNQMLNILMQLRKCCNHPYLFDGIEEPPYIEGNHLIETSGKMSLLDKLLPRLKKENSRVLLFSQMTRVLDIIDDYCRWKNYEYLRIDGSTVGDERQIRINQFNEPNSKYFIFLLSTRAGGIGINLTTADIVILFDSDYNPQMDIQAMDRAHRIGQKKKVIVYRFVTQNSVEEKIVERAAKKLKLDSLIIQKGKLNLNNKENNKQELHDILNFGAPEVYKTQDISSISDEDIDIILADAEKRTIEIENKLKNLENIFDLSNISLDGGLNMYNGLTKDGSEESSDEEYSDSEDGEDEEDGNYSEGDHLEGQEGAEGGGIDGVIRKKKKKKNLNKIRSTIKKFLKNNKKNMTFLDLGERKSKWKVINSTSNKIIKKKIELQGWKAEAKGGHDFQFFNNAKLDELERLEERWSKYRVSEDKIRKIIDAQSEEKDFEKYINFSDFLDWHGKNIYEIINLIYPNIFDEHTDEEVAGHPSGNGAEGGSAINQDGVSRAEDVVGGANDSSSEVQQLKRKIIKLFESKKKLSMVRFRDKNVKVCYEYLVNFVKRHLGENNNEESSNSKKSKSSKPVRKTIDHDLVNIDIDQIRNEKEELLKEGFPLWNKAEFNKLMTGLILYGSEDIEFIHEKYFGNSKKTLEDILAYLRVFFRRYNEVKGGKRLFDRIQKSDLQRQLIEEENDLIADFVEKQLSDGVDTIDKLELPPNLCYEPMPKLEEPPNPMGEVKEEKETKNPMSEEEIAYYERESKILLWLLYQQGVVHTKSIHILTPYYWAQAQDFFKYASTPFEHIEYRCRLIIDAVVQMRRRVSQHVGCWKNG